MEETKPGSIITPGAAVSPAPPTGTPQPERPTEVVPPAPAPTPSPEPATTFTEPLAAQPTAPAGNWNFTAESGSNSVPTGLEQAPTEEITWTASEFIAHEKSAAWYALLGLAGVAGAAVVYFITKDKVSTGVILLAFIAMAVFAARKPKVLQYSVNNYGVQIEQRMYALQGFKSFSVTEEGAIASIVFMPLKRFMPALTIYVAPDIEDKVVDCLSDVLPFERHRQDVVDSLLKHIRF